MAIKTLKTITSSTNPSDVYKVTVDWNDSAQVENKPEFKTVNGESIVGSGNIEVVTPTVVAIDENSTNTEIPSAKLLYDLSAKHVVYGREMEQNPNLSSATDLNNTNRMAAINNVWTEDVQLSTVVIYSGVAQNAVLFFYDKDNANTVVFANPYSLVAGRNEFEVSFLFKPSYRYGISCKTNSCYANSVGSTGGMYIVSGTTDTVGGTVTEGTTLASYGIPVNLIGSTIGSTTVTEAQEKLVSGTNIKTVNGKSLLGEGNLALSGNKTYSTYACIGDSISYGANSSDGKTSWCNYLAEKIGATLQKRAGNGQKIWENMYSQVNGINADTEFITIMIGVNDCSEIADASNEKTMYGTDKTIADVINAEFDSSNQTNGLYTDYGVIGRFRWCVEYAKVKAPNARIMVITPLPYNNNTTLEEMVKAEASICNAIYTEVYIPTDSEEFNTQYFQGLQADNLHPNDAGYKAVAGWVYQRI